jgi:hypothetical protein
MSKNLLKKYGNLPRRKEDDPFFAIWRHYHDTDVSIVLTPHQEQRLSIYEKAKDLYDEGFSRGEAAKNLQVHFFEEKGIEFSIRTAYSYLQDAIDLFGAGEAIDLSREKHTMIEIGKRLMKKAEKAEEYKAAATFYQSLIKLYGFDKENDEVAELLKKMKPLQIVITNDPEVLRREAKELIQDVEHEDVTHT